MHKREFHVRVGSLEELKPSSWLHSISLKSILISKMPSWVNGLSVPLLSLLELHVEAVEAQDLQILGRLPSLINLAFFSAEKRCVSYTVGSDEFQKLKLLMTNIEISLGEGALPMLETLAYSASAGRKDILVPWNKKCPLLDDVECVLDCANIGRREVKAAKAVLRKAQRTHPNAEDLRLRIDLLSYKRKAARLIDALSSILPGLDRTDGEEITADQQKLRRMVTSLETLLRHAAEPRLGRYGEHEIRGFVAKLKNILHDDAVTDEEGEANNSDDDYDTNTDTGDSNSDDDDSDYDDNDHNYDKDTEQKEVDDDVATSMGGHGAFNRIISLTASMLLHAC